LKKTKQNLSDNLALQAHIVLSPGQPLKPSKCAQIAPENVCSILKLRCDSMEMGSVGICCARFLDATGGLGETCVLDAMGMLHAMGASVQRGWPAGDGFSADVSRSRDSWHRNGAFALVFLVLGKLGVG
jgi:hypothetical protein